MENTAVEDDAGDGEDGADTWAAATGGDDNEAGGNDDSDGSGAYTTVKISAAAVIPK